MNSLDLNADSMMLSKKTLFLEFDTLKQERKQF